MSRIGAVWESIERVWLDPVREPLHRRIADATWSPDSFDAYCDRCGSTIGAHERHEFGCSGCVGRRPAWDRIVRLGSFEREVRDWVHEAKFEVSHSLAVALGRLLGARLREAGVLRTGVPMVVVPVPTSRVRRFTRGIDHTAWIARGVAKELGIPVQRLLRARHGPSQRAVAPSQRAANVRGRFVLRTNPPAGAGFIVVDDVMTTGATVSQAVRAIRSPGTVRWCGVVGVTPAPGRDRGWGADSSGVE